MDHQRKTRENRKRGSGIVMFACNQLWLIKKKREVCWEGCWEGGQPGGGIIEMMEVCVFQMERRREGVGL